MRNLSTVLCMGLNLELSRHLYHGLPFSESIVASSLAAETERMMKETAQIMRDVKDEDQEVPMQLAVFLREYTRFLTELNDALLEHCDDYAVASTSLEARYDNG